MCSSVSAEWIEEFIGINMQQPVDVFFLCQVDRNFEIKRLPYLKLSVGVLKEPWIRSGGFGFAPRAPQTRIVPDDSHLVVLPSQLDPGIRRIIKEKKKPRKANCLVIF